MIIVVLGMHRSGTSLLSGLMHCSNINAGSKLLGPLVSNPKGHFEHLGLMELNDIYMKMIGSSWHDPSYKSLNDNKCSSWFGNEIKYWLNKDFREKVNFIKDPRISVLRPSYKKIMSSLGKNTRILVMIRDPFQVINSHKKRDNMPPLLSGLLWMKYNISILEEINLEQGYMLTYDDLIEDSLGVIHKIRDEFNLHNNTPLTPDVSKKISGFVDKSLNRSNSKFEGMEEVDKKLELTNMHNRIRSEIYKNPNGQGIDLKILGYYRGVFEKNLRIYNENCVWQHNGKKGLYGKANILKYMFKYYATKLIKH